MAQSRRSAFYRIKQAGEIKVGDTFYDGHCWAKCTDTDPAAGKMQLAPVRLETRFRATYWKSKTRICTYVGGAK